MTPAEYVRRRGRGAITQLVRDALLAPPTVRRAVRGIPIMRANAEQIVKASGGAITLAEIALCGLKPLDASA